MKFFSIVLLFALAFLSPNYIVGKSAFTKSLSFKYSGGLSKYQPKGNEAFENSWDKYIAGFTSKFGISRRTTLGSKLFLNFGVSFLQIKEVLAYGDVTFNGNDARKGFIIADYEDPEIQDLELVTQLIQAPLFISYQLKIAKNGAIECKTGIAIGYLLRKFERGAVLKEKSDKDDTEKRNWNFDEHKLSLSSSFGIAYRHTLSNKYFISAEPSFEYFWTSIYNHENKLFPQRISFMLAFGFN